MTLTREGEIITAEAESGEGSAPGLFFRGRLSEQKDVPEPLRGQFSTFGDYTRWIMDQHLSVTVWGREAVVQEMHLTLEGARVRAVEPLEVEAPTLGELVESPARPLAGFLGENLEVWLDSIRAFPRIG